MKKILKSFLFIVLLTTIFLPFVNIYAQEEINTQKFAISFTGIGCPHCAKVAPKLYEQVEKGNLILIEYEIYKILANSQALNEYSKTYDLSLGIPQILFNKELHQAGDTPILDNLEEMITNSQADTIPLANGKTVTFEEFSLGNLQRYPKIYSKDRIAIRQSLTELSDEEDSMIKNFIYASSLEDALKGLDGKKAKVEKVDTSAGVLKYENALKVNGWLLQWNGEGIEGGSGTEGNEGSEESSGTLSIGRIITLGLADSVNPCALSILALVLISIVTYNPGSRKDILLAGLAFVGAVLIMYLLYGFLIIKAFEVVQSITSIREFLYGSLGINFILGIGAIILGVLGLKDFFAYKPGSVGTEMPLFLRPKVTKLIAKVTSPIAAFTVGLFVTLFLLPCTIGPYVILGGLLAGDGFLTALPSLIFYNVIFVLPMIAVTLIVYFGSRKAEDVKDWKERNVRYMHLVAGVLLLIIGVLMVLGKF